MPPSPQGALIPKPLELVHDADEQSLSDLLASHPLASVPPGKMTMDQLKQLMSRESACVRSANMARLNIGAELRQRLLSVDHNGELAVLTRMEEQSRLSRDELIMWWLTAELLWLLDEHGPPGAVQKHDPLLSEMDLDEVMLALMEPVMAVAAVQLVEADLRAQRLRAVGHPERIEALIKETRRKLARADAALSREGDS